MHLSVYLNSDFSWLLITFGPFIPANIVMATYVCIVIAALEARRNVPCTDRPIIWKKIPLSFREHPGAQWNTPA